MISAAPELQTLTYYVFSPKKSLSGEVYGPIDIRDIYPADRGFYNYYPIEDYEFWDMDSMKGGYVILWPEGVVSVPYTQDRAMGLADTLPGSVVKKFNSTLYF